MDNPSMAVGYEIGRIIGAFLILLLITRLILLAFRKRKYTVMAVVISLIIGTGIGVLLAGVANLRGNPALGGEAFAEAVATYLIPVGLVLAIDLIRLWLRRSGQRDAT